MAKKGMDKTVASLASPKTGQHCRRLWRSCIVYGADIKLDAVLGSDNICQSFGATSPEQVANWQSHYLYNSYERLWLTKLREQQLVVINLACNDGAIFSPTSQHQGSFSQSVLNISNLRPLYGKLTGKSFETRQLFGASFGPIECAWCASRVAVSSVATAVANRDGKQAMRMMAACELSAARDKGEESEGSRQCARWVRDKRGWCGTHMVHTGSVHCVSRARLGSACARAHAVRPTTRLAPIPRNVHGAVQTACPCPHRLLLNEYAVGAHTHLCVPPASAPAGDVRAADRVGGARQPLFVTGTYAAAGSAYK
ncbi:hypothetical protein C8R45DRAFT_945751 [Mycena sanguinolenta]|nr:hypothetical protein C8R45DRAFT_945751 [Mycena sanguinolenta]